MAGGGGGKLLSPERRRCAVGRAREQYGISERHACRLLGQGRGTQRYEPMDRPDEDALTRAVIELATQYGRYGYRRITALLLAAGRAESAAETKAKKTVVVQRRFLRAAKAGAAQPRVELRLCQRQNRGGEKAAHPDADG